MVVERKFSDIWIKVGRLGFIERAQFVGKHFYPDCVNNLVEKMGEFGR